MPAAQTQGIDRSRCSSAQILALPYPTLFLAYTLPAMQGRLTEAGMVGFLVSANSLNVELVAAAAVIFRLGSVFFQALLGALVYFFFWGGEKEKEPGGAHAKGICAGCSGFWRYQPV